MRVVFEIHQVKSSFTPYSLRAVSISADGETFTGEPVLCESLEEARSHVPRGLDRAVPQRGDPESLVEAWA